MSAATYRDDVIYLVSYNPFEHEYKVHTPQGWSTYHSLKRAREAHPSITTTHGISYRDFKELTPPVVVETEAGSLSAEETPEKLYLVHTCGEAFEDWADAYVHVCESVDEEADYEWNLLPESEAF
jgi:hypothetical protein